MRQRWRLFSHLGLATLLLSGAVAHADAATAPHVRTVTVFERGAGGYHTFRIPAIVKATDGTLLAFAEARVNDPDDDGDIDLVLKRSADGGSTWGPLQVVANDGPNKWGNPVPIVDRATGRIIVNTTRTGGDVTTGDVHCGLASPEQTRRSFVAHSDDHGATWTAPVEITAQVKPANWRHFVGGPAHGIQLTKGEHAGRLVIPGNHSVAPPPGSGIDCRSATLHGGHSLYSDDGGVTWHLGGDDTPLTGVFNPNESVAAELDDGTVYFSARDQGGTSPGRRLHTTSSDGGASFDAPYRAVDGIVTTQIQGSVLVLPGPRGRVVLSAPGHPTARENLTLWSSFDQTATWHRGLTVYSGPSGYSDLVEVRDRTLGVLFENGDRLHDDPYLTYHQRISFALVPLALLDTPGTPSRITPDDAGQAQHATVSGRPHVVPGKFGSALELAGDYVETPPEQSLSFGDGPFTAAAWFRSTNQVHQQAVLWGHANIAGEPKWWIRLEPDLGRIRAALETTAGSRTLTAPGQFADGAWHHVALTRDGSGVTLYVDGSPVATGAPISGSVSAGARMGIRAGARVDGINNPLRGAIDEVWLFDRALTAEEVVTVYRDNARLDGARLHLPLDLVRSEGPA